MKHSFCEDWEFTRHWTEAFGKGLPVPKQQAVRLPHTCREVPLHYASPADYEMVCGYRKRFRVPPVQAAPRLFLRFDGAAHQAVVRVNGRVAGQHRGGYTGFAVEITDLVDREGENLLTVQLDTREDPAIPPFGFVIDYLTYGGLYREVWLEATAESRLTDLFVYTPTLHDAMVQWTAELTPAAVAVRIRLETADGTLLAQQTAQAAETGKMQLSVPDAQPWDTEHPVLHHAVAELLNAAGQAIDRKQVTFGFRTAEFRADGFYLNGKKTFLRGLNRHQSYPYIGYAAPESLQREDARILQEELHCTAVRTSHYPQVHIFWTSATGGVCWCSPNCRAGSTSGTTTGRTPPARCCRRCSCRTAITPASSCGACASTRAWTTMPSTPAPIKLPISWTPAAPPPVCGIWKKAICWRMSMPTTIFPTTA